MEKDWSHKLVVCRYCQRKVLMIAVYDPSNRFACELEKHSTAGMLHCITDYGEPLTKGLIGVQGWERHNCLHKAQEGGPFTSPTHTALSQLKTPSRSKKEQLEDIKKQERDAKLGLFE